MKRGRPRGPRKCGCNECFNCPYPDCILDDSGKLLVAVREHERIRQQEWRKQNPERTAELNKKWRDKNTEKIKQYKKQRTERLRLERMKLCFWCGKENTLQTEIIKCHKHYFCSDSCAAAYLLDRAKKEDVAKYVLYGSKEAEDGPEN